MPFPRFESVSTNLNERTLNWMGKKEVEVDAIKNIQVGKRERYIQFGAMTSP